MAQHDMILDNATGAAFRSDANGALAALVSLSSGATAPAPTYAYQHWADTTTGLLKIRNAANSAWVTVATLSTGAAITSDGLSATALAVANTWTGVQTISVGASQPLILNGTLSTQIGVKASGTLYGNWGANSSWAFACNNAANNTLACGVTDTGNFTATLNVTAYSDERLKTNWARLSSDFIQQLSKVKHGTYDRIDRENVRQIGVSAQSLQALMPEAITTGEDGMLSVAYGNAALAACVELAKEVVALRSELAEVRDLVGG